jgi:hypothetical protein
MHVLCQWWRHPVGHAPAALITMFLSGQNIFTTPPLHPPKTKQDYAFRNNVPRDAVNWQRRRARRHVDALAQILPCSIGTYFPAWGTNETLL